MDQHPAHSSPPRFLADVMLGSLAKWLRILGYDTVYDNTIRDDEIVVRCQREERIALTRDTRLVQRRRLTRCLFIETEDLFAQLRQVLDFLGHEVKPDRLLSRCLECNRPLERISREAVRPRVPPYVFETQKGFKRCPRCDRLYWGGTHRQNIYEQLKARL